MADVLPHKALYYPHLEFGSAAWVKGALLYWDGLARILGQVHPVDDPEIHEMVEAGLIEPISIDPFTDEVHRMFGDRFADLLHQRGGFPESVPSARGLRGRSDELIAQHLEKLAGTMEAQGHREVADAVRRMPDRALPVVSTFAAYVIAGKRGLAPVTDDPLFSAMETYFAEEKVTNDPTTAPAALAAADLLVPSPSVEALASLSVAQLLEVRDKLAGQRRSFRNKVEAHRAAIAKLPDLDAVQEHVRAFASEIRDDLDAQRDALKQAKVKDDWSYLSVTAPASLAVGMTLGSTAPILGPVAGVGAVALGVSNWYVQRRKGSKGSGNYMLSLQAEMGRKGRGLESGLDKLLSR
jgi:hypothetical protein